MRQLGMLPGKGGMVEGGFQAQARQALKNQKAVLEAAGLVSCQWQGREKLHYLNPVPIAEISRRWLDRFSGRRAKAILNLRDALQENEHE